MTTSKRKGFWGGHMDERMLKYTATKTGLGLNYVDKEEKISLLLSQL